MKIQLLSLLFLFGAQGFAQNLLELSNLNDFKPQIGNWKVVGEVQVNPAIDVHDMQNHEQETKSKKRRRRRKEVEERPKAVAYKSGTGILLNMNDSEKKDRLETRWKHGDIKLDMEVMIPKGSNSGIYLQGRYELQLKDSWGVIHPKVSDMGGIHNNWETDPDKIFRGIPPLHNACKAPGLWQKLNIHFQAPKFNDKGEKMANARFVSVVLNGVVIHTNVEVPQYTGSPIEKNEVSEGPLVIQGDHGPVAFRNIKYQLLEPSDVSMSAISYKTYKGEFKGLEELQDADVVTEGQTQFIDVNLTGEEDNYGISFSGTLNIPEEGLYHLSLGYTGGVAFYMDSVSVLQKNAADRQEMLDTTLTLSQGEHDFVLNNIKSAGWRAPRLGLTVGTASTYPSTFHTYDSYPPAINTVSPIFVQPNTEPRCLRAFVSFGGDGKRLSHTIGVGTPEGVNYIYDLGSGNLVGLWRGDFVDATPMWHERGDGSFKPRGAVQWTFLNQPIAQLSDAKALFPETGHAPEFISKGYVIDETTRLPVFKQVYRGVDIENRIEPNSTNTHVVREVRFSETGVQNWYFKLASGIIQQRPDGSYAINGEYYIKLLTDQVPVMREVDGETELVIAVDGSLVKYELIW
ncbi:3-keto-disaccharide hydrolase [Aestuariivivens sediminis]|uniref:3-keto-disaccharide hydrolase n=1 Tax=Aestuariivivens sediminis TaxID=2913557 RepID=UPI001F5860CE|nr:DUF1080 domain-containing protein [Aestuariivivens sediminis]